MADEVVVAGAVEGAVIQEPAVEGPRGLRGPRLVLVVAGVAVLCLVVGLLAGRFVVSPAQAAADAAPPQAGPIVAPVEERALSNDVVLRADAVYADAVEVLLETGEISGPAVVTGQVPETGTQLDPAGVLLEIAGRPVIVLPGDLPVYRTLRAGTSGPDVLQYKAALASLGIDAGDVDSDVYDARTAAGTEALYAMAGYPSPEASEDAQAALAAARETVRSARSAVQDAEAALVTAGHGPGDVEKLQADNAVRAAERQLAQAQQDAAAQEAAKSAAQDSGTPPEGDVPVDAPVDVAGAQDALALARAERAALDAPRDTSAERAMLDGARDALEDAQAELAKAQEQVLTALPASEVVYVAGLPRRVDETYVERGGLVNGPVAAVSGATLMLEAAVSASDADLLEAGAVGEFELSDGTTVTATVLTIGDDTAPSGDPASDDGEGDDGGGSQGPTSSRVSVALEPQDLTPEQVELLRGENVRVTIAVGTTDGDVLTVPIAALTAGPGGESRVEVVREGSGSAAATELVEVTTGLAAEGFVEIVSAEGDLVAGDEVVVGR